MGSITIGSIGESTRLDNIALLCGMIVAIDQKIFTFMTNVLMAEGHLSDSLTSERVSEILMILEVFVEIMARIYDKSIFGTLRRNAFTKVCFI